MMFICGHLEKKLPIIKKKLNLLKAIKVSFLLTKKYCNANGINKKRKYVVEEINDLLKSAAQNEDKII